MVGNYDWYAYEREVSFANDTEVGWKPSKYHVATSKHIDIYLKHNTASFTYKDMTSAALEWFGE